MHARGWSAVIVETSCVTSRRAPCRVEQDRASAVLLHHRQLARQTAHRARDARQPDRLHDHPQWPEGLCSTRRRQLPRQVTVSDAELEVVTLHGHAFHPDWHDTRESRGIPWRRLTLHVEGAATATAYDAVGLFVRHGSREVDGTPRSDVLGEPSSTTAC